MHAVSTNQIADILHFNDNVMQSLVAVNMIKISFLAEYIARHTVKLGKLPRSVKDSDTGQAKLLF